MQPVSIEDKAQDLLNALTSLGDGWHTRAQLAAKLGKNQLNPGDITLLDLLVNQGKLDREARQGSRTNLSQWVYRVKQD